MAREYVVLSDLSRTVGGIPCSFGLDDTWYDLDLTVEEKNELDRLLRPYIQVARPTEKQAGAFAAPKRIIPESDKTLRKAIRDWAEANGYSPDSEEPNKRVALNSRGRIPAVVQDAYDRAHGVERDSLGRVISLGDAPAGALFRARRPVVNENDTTSQDDTGKATPPTPSS